MAEKEIQPTVIAPIETVPVAAPQVAPQVSPQVGMTTGYSSNINNTPYKITPSQAQSIVASAGIDPNQVLSANNVQQTINSPAPAPDDLLGIRSQIYANEGVNEAQSAFMAAKANASTLLNNMNARLTSIGNRAVSLSKITGVQGQERLISQGEIDAANADVANKLQEYQLKKGNADEIFQIRNAELSEKKALMTQYAGAGIKPSDSFEQAMKKIEKYAEEKEKDVYKDALKAEARALGISTKGSRKDLEKRISKANKESLDRAKQKSDLEMEQMRANIENTKKSTANIGARAEGAVSTGTLEKDGDGNIFNVIRDKNTGEIISMEPFTGGVDVNTGGGWGTAVKGALGGATMAALAIPTAIEQTWRGRPGGPGVASPGAIAETQSNIWDWIWN